MNGRRRRPVVQLAALVDFLFIVMFLQFLQIQGAAERGEKDRKTAVEGRKEAEEGRKDAVKLKKDVLVDQVKLTKERDEYHHQVEELKKQLAKTEGQRGKDREEAKRQIEEIGQAMKALLGVDAQKLKDQLEGASDEQRAKVFAELKNAQSQNPAQLIQTLRKSAELGKRCDIWEVHLFPDGTVRVKAPGIEARKFFPKNEDDFTNLFMEIVQETSEPKSLVLILFTYGNAENQHFVIAKKGLEQAQIKWRGKLTSGKAVEVSAPNYSEDAP